MVDDRLLHHWACARAARLADSEREMGYVLHAYLKVLARRRRSLRLVAGADEAAQHGGTAPIAVRARHPVSGRPDLQDG
jgi:hypothetical protein